MKSKILFVFLALAANVSLIKAEYYKAIEMAESSPIEQNRFYPRWSEKMSLSKTYYGIEVDLARPSKDQQEKWKKIVRIFLEDLFEQEKGAKARIFAPQGLINPVVLQDGREFFRAFWKDKVNNERRITDKIEIMGLADGHKWSEVWVRFVEMDRYPSLEHTNYVAMLIETPPDDEPYLADLKVLGRAPTGLETDRSLRKLVGLRKFATQPQARTQRDARDPYDDMAPGSALHPKLRK